MITIVTNKDDIHADFVIQELHQRGTPFIRINTEDFPKMIKGTLSVSNSDSYGGRLQLPAGVLDLNSITSVWYRRPLEPEIDPRVIDPGVRDHSLREARSFLDSVWYTLDCLWVNHPLYNIAAGEKLTQLNKARSVGFNIPDTLVTSDPEHATSFIQSHGKVIVKPLKRNRVQIWDEEVKIFYTSFVTPEHLDQIETVALCPVFLEEYVEKAFELRVTVIGTDIFAAAIDSQNTTDAEVDWRMANNDLVPYKCYELPVTVQQKCRELLKKFKLNFGAIDLIVTPDGEFVFLEINPNGQWVWVEHKTGMPMISSMINLLEGKQN